jgi:hypothetical protein
MKMVKAIMAASALALAGGVYAADEKKGHIGFNEIDANNDGKLTREEVRASGNTWLLQRFDEADKAGDGVLTRGEYLSLMGRKDLRTAQEAMKDAAADVRERVEEARRDESAAAGGSGAASGQTR